MELVNLTCQQRGVAVEDCELHVGFDGGQGSLKVALSITDKVPIISKGRSKYAEVKINYHSNI